jgi:hypothetical protein
VDLFAKHEAYTDKINAGVWYTVVDETTGLPLGGDEKPVRVLLASHRSNAVKKLQAKQNAHQLQMLRKKGLKGLTQDAIDDSRFSVLVVATLDWENVEWKGAKLACMPANVETVYKTVDWFADQVDRFIHEPSNFADEDEAEDAEVTELEEDHPLRPENLEPEGEPGSLERVVDEAVKN